MREDVCVNTYGDFSMISLHFFNTYIFLSRRYINFTPYSQRSEREGKREWDSASKDWSLTNSWGYFVVTLTFISVGMFCEI